MMKVSKIKANPSNPRVIKDEKFKKLVKSLQEFPEMMEKRPMVCVTDVDGRIYPLGGNMRLRAIQELGMKEIPDTWVMMADDWTEDKRREFTIKDNVGFGEWEWDQLANEWDVDQLEEWGLDIPGFDNQKVLEAEEDDYEIPDEVKTDIVLGDLFEIGEHRLLCGDSTDGGNVEKLMNKEQAVLLHADPPYGMGKEKEGVLNDNLYKDKLDRFQMEWWTAFRPYLTNNASAYIWGKAPDLWRLWYKGGLEDSERMTMRNEIVWFKPPSGLGDGQNNSMNRSFGSITERCLFFMLGEQGFNNNADNYWEGWESIRSYLEEEMKRCGWGVKDLNRITGTQMAGHWVTKSQWGLITPHHYEKIQSAANEHNAFKKEHDQLKKEHDQLKKEHDQLKKDFYETRAYFDNTHDNMTEVWQFERVTGEERHGHATPKPIEMMNRIIKSSSPDNALMVEPFLGSGSTMVAAHQLGRKCYGMDLDPKYCQVIVDRMHKLDPSLEIKRNGQPYTPITE